MIRQSLKDEDKLAESAEVEEVYNFLWVHNDTMKYRIVYQRKDFQKWRTQSKLKKGSIYSDTTEDNGYLITLSRVPNIQTEEFIGESCFAVATTKYLMDS